MIDRWIVGVVGFFAAGVALCFVGAFPVALLTIVPLAYCFWKAINQSDAAGDRTMKDGK